MPSVESPVLIDLFLQLESSKNTKTKSELLGKAKYLIFNSMSNEQIIEFFADKLNFENLFSLNIWTRSLEETSITEFSEPYEIIERIFSCFTSMLELFSKFREKVFFLINQDQDEKVKHILLKHLIQLAKSLTDQEVKNRLEPEIAEILPALIKQIPAATLSYSSLLSEFICILALKFSYVENVQTNFKLIFTDEMINELEETSKQNSVIKFRVFELIVKLAACSNELTNVSELKFNLSKKLNEYLNDKNDVLSRINCIEILTDLAVTNYGYDLLYTNGHLKILYQDLNNEDDVFTLPSILKLFSVLTRLRPSQMNENFPGYFEFLFKHVFTDDLVRYETAMKLSLETFGYLFESNEMKAFFNQFYTRQFNSLLDKLVWFLKNSIKDDLRINCLICITELIATDCKLLTLACDTDIKWQTSESVFNPIWINLAYSYYQRLISTVTHEDLFNLCLTIAKQPWSQTRLAAHLYFKAMAQTKWGLTLLFTPNKYNEKFLDDYLMNRTTEIEKLGLESKYELIKLINANFNLNTDLSHLIDENDLLKISTYVRQGAIYSISQFRVATENL